MAKSSKPTPDQAQAHHQTRVSATVDELLQAAQERGDESFETGRTLLTFKDQALDDGINHLKHKGFRIADARDFDQQLVDMTGLGDADALFLPEIGVALACGAKCAEQQMSPHHEIPEDSPIAVVEPEYFMFANDTPNDYLRGFMRAVETIAQDLRGQANEPEIDPEVLGVTWGLAACKVPASARSGLGIKVAILDTGLDLGHPDFAGRNISAASFVGQPVQDGNGHGTHTTGTATGTKTPPGTNPRYGIAYRSHIFMGKVLTNAGSGSSATVLAGMNWAIAQRCAVISMSLGSQSPVQAAFTAAGQAALLKGCLMIAAAGNASSQTGAPANSPTIMSIAALDPNLHPSSFSNFGKIELAAPGRDVFSSVPMPRRYAVFSGTSMAAPHVAGCAALWAECNPALRGQLLWNKLLATAKPLPFAASKVGKGLVQAP